MEREDTPSSLELSPDRQVGQEVPAIGDNNNEEETVTYRQGVKRSTRTPVIDKSERAKITAFVRSTATTAMHARLSLKGRGVEEIGQVGLDSCRVPQMRQALASQIVDYGWKCIDLLGYATSTNPTWDFVDISKVRMNTYVYDLA